MRQARPALAIVAGLLLSWPPLSIGLPGQVLQLAPAPALLWVEANGSLKPAAYQAMTVLRNAGEEGLDAERYGYARLVELAQDVARGQPAADASSFDATLTHAVLEYLQHRRHGRLGPAPSALLTARLRDAVARDELDGLIQEMTPSRMNYQALRALLTKYRALAADPGLRAIPFPSSAVHPGGRIESVPALYRWLVALGDIPAFASPPVDDLYDDWLVAGVRHFQQRHGLDPDGIIGAATRAALTTPLGDRVRQIELALERIRALGDPGNRKSIVLNTPMFLVWGWDSEQQDARPTITLRAIVGRPVTPTPQLEAEIRRLTFRPYWNVPPSILHGELLPLVTADPAYVERQDMEIVRHEGGATRVVPTTSDSLDGLRSGALGLRQRPGPANALSLLKFTIESDTGIHLHGTPHQYLFEQIRRAFSHGCIRVDDPIALAEWILDDPVNWPPERVIAATAGPDDHEVRLARPVYVSLFYATAAIDPEDGTLRFSQDLYDLDVHLERALGLNP